MVIDKIAQDIGIEEISPESSRVLGKKNSQTKLIRYKATFSGLFRS
jgi:hypothetical protein